ncbi:acetyltransferase [Mycobacterium tuberculosis]|nr:acetyltransferase [Mycobacterium tuberculosis]
MTPQARPARRADVRELSRTMARAFYDDPVMSWLLSNDNARTARLTRLFATIVRHQHLAGGGVEVARGAAGIGGAALWDPPDRWRESRRQQLAMTPGFLRVFGFRTAKARAALDVMMRVHPEEPTGIWPPSAATRRSAARGSVRC